MKCPRATALTAAATLLATSCSLVSTRGGPDNVAGPTPPACSTSKAPLYVDGAVAGAAVGTSLFLGLAALGNSGKREQLGYATLFTLLGGVAFSVSSLVGSLRVRSCRKAHQTWRMMQVQAPPPYAPPAPGGPYLRPMP